jgi:Zc3h12a-like Ribonuclease NYN domain
MPNETAPRRRIVVDGSNIATEGRSLPSLVQLDEAIRTFLDEFRGFTSSDVTVVVDASFGHRIEESERSAFEEAVLHGEMVTPPAGAVGRGDGFILRIAEKSGALVLSNDSFQEFHAERPWLFDEGRLIGGKPVPGVGWVFTPRSPVRGQKSRSVTSRSRRVAAIDGDIGDGVPDGYGELHDSGLVKGAKGAKVAKAAKAAKAVKIAKAVKTDKVAKSAKPDKAAKTDKAAKSGKVDKAAKANGAAKSGKSGKASKEITSSASSKVAKSARSAKSEESANGGKVASITRAAKTNGAKSGNADATPIGSSVPALNDPMTFLTFVAEHPIGSTFDGTVVAYTSHGAHVDVGPMRCHVPLRGLAIPAPVKARDVVAKGEVRRFVLVSLEAGHRRAELALSGLRTGSSVNGPG